MANTSQRLRIAVLLATSLTLVLGVALGSNARETAQLEGTYQWNQGDSGPLTASFRSTGEDSWKVSFRFRFSGDYRTYEGVATGSLGEGGLSGVVKSNRSRTWNFRGEFDDQGIFSGKHFEVSRSGKERESGSLTMQ